MSGQANELALSPEQRAELAQALRSAPTARLYRRVKIIDLASRGHSIDEVAELFDVSPRSVQHYLERYRRGGVAALPDALRSGRPRKLPPEYDRGPESQATWQRLLDRRPSTIPAYSNHVKKARAYACQVLSVTATAGNAFGNSRANAPAPRLGA